MQISLSISFRRFSHTHAFALGARPIGIIPGLLILDLRTKSSKAQSGAEQRDVKYPQPKLKIGFVAFLRIRSGAYPQLVAFD